MNLWHTLFATWWTQIAALVPIVNNEHMHEEEGSHRGRLIHRLLTLQRRSASEAASHQRQIDALNADIRKAESRVNELCTELQMAWGRKMAESLRVQTEIDRLSAELAAAAPPGLDRLLEQVSVEIEQVRRFPTMEPKLIDRLTKLRHVREQAVALQTAPLSLADVLTQLKRLEHAVA